MSLAKQYQVPFESHQPQETYEFMAIPFPEEQTVPIRPYYKYELANLYGVCLPTLLNFIAPHLPAFEALGYRKNTKILTPKMVELLFKKVGKP